MATRNFTRTFELPISSNYINAANFLVFDVVLISLVYLLTSDIMGRLNDSTLRDGEPHRVTILCPPVLGGGLCTTHQARGWVLLILRLLGLGLILMTNMTIKGKNTVSVIKVNSAVLARGNVSKIKDAEDFAEKTLLRSSCQGGREPAKAGNEGNTTILYYGEIRGKERKCITNRSLLNLERTVEFSSQILNRTMTTGKQPCMARARTRFGFKVAEYFCPQATLSCLFAPGEPEPDLESCRGLLEHKGETYICEEGSAFPEMYPPELTEARWVKGLHFRDTFWLDGIFFSTNIMKDAIDAGYAMRTEERTVLEEKKLEKTVIDVLWFVALAFKLMLVFALGLTSFFLKRAGFHTVLHDEQRLAQLLSTRIEENDPYGRRRTTGIEEGSIFLNAEQSTDGLLVTADSRPRRNSQATAPGGAALRPRRNSEIHRLEAMYA